MTAETVAHIVPGFLDSPIELVGSLLQLQTLLLAKVLVLFSNR